MKISSVNHNLSFQKILVANTAYIKDDSPCGAKIYQLDRDEDADYIKKLNKSVNWKRNNYLLLMRDDFNSVKQYNEMFAERQKDFFVMEDENNECISIVEVQTNQEDVETNVEFFEVCPKYASEFDGRRAKYIGETFISFLANYTNDVLNTDLVVYLPHPQARKFYEKCGFLLDDEEGYYMPQNKIAELTQKNNDRTGCKMEVVV